MKSSKEFTCEFVNDAKTFFNNNSSDDDLIVRISNKELKEQTGRQRIKKTFITEIKDKLEKAGCEISKCDSDLCVTVPRTITETKIMTLSDLKSGKDSK